MDTCTALVPTADGGWRRYRDPVRMLCARRPEEVVPCLAAVEAGAEAGLTAVGGVAYEAAPAFDAALATRPAQGPLALFGLFEGAEPGALPPAAAPAPVLAPELGRPAYLRALARIHDHLAAGDSYQVNFTHPLRGSWDGDPEALFAALHGAQPSTRALYLRWGQLAVCSVSPERFFRLDGETIEMEPMKGTRPRAADPQRDAALRGELLSSPKERAENLMIVDMVRSDLGRIAEAGSVTAEALFRIVAMPTVWQQVSTVRARTGAGLVELFRALFPCASVTGAPKRETMRIIERLEAGPRGFYTGALGVVGPGRRADFSVGIRTLLLDLGRKTACYGVGSGVVWDSEGAAEWRETLLKARTLGEADPFALLETMRWTPQAGIERRALHVERLRTSAAHFDFPLDAGRLARRLDEFSAEGPCRLRLLLHRDGRIELEPRALLETPEPVRLRLASAPVDSRDPFLRHKTTARQVYERARAGAGEADDVLLWNERGELTETCIHNVFLEIDGELLTPPTESGLLGGVFRRSLLDAGRARTRVLTRADLARASRLLVSNSVRGLREAVLLDP